MTGWLASVTDAREALRALAAGAHIIDAKNPRAGALGALAPDLVEDIVAAVAGRAPVSATIGDFPAMETVAVVAAVAATAATGVDFIKIGLFPGPALAPCLEGLAAPARRHRLVAVLFADRAPDLRLLDRLAALGFAGAMLDTADKGGGGLTRHLSGAELAGFVERARSLGLLCGLAGSLKAADIPHLLPLAPDYLGFRGALCRNQARAGHLSEEGLRAVAGAMARVPEALASGSNRNAWPDQTARRFPRCAAKPTNPSPASNSVQVSGSGTGAVTPQLATTIVWGE